MASSDESLLLNFPKLCNAESFQLWDFELKILFKARNLWSVVDGTELLDERVTGKEKRDEWITKDAKAQYYIVRTLDRPAKNHILSCTTSKQMYDALTAIYRRDTTQLKQSLLLDFHSYQYDKSKDIMQNISHLRNIVFKLEQFQQDVSEEMLMAKILVSLPDQYRYFSAAWDSTPTADKNVENLTARLCLEEEKYKNRSKNEDLNVAFFAKNNKSKQKKPVVCHKCGESGHIKPKCPKKKWCKECKSDSYNEEDCYNKNKNHTRKHTKNVPCVYCKKTNHQSDDCYFKQQHENKNKDKVSFLVETINTGNEVLYTHEDDTNKFIVDSGSTSHLINKCDLLSSTRYCEEKIYSAKKNDYMTAELSGKIDDGNVIFNNVSYVPQLSRNLLSVKCITENGGEVRFKKGQVDIVKDDKIVISGTQTESGLFVVDLKKQEKAAAYIAIKDEAMEWHRKLGHVGFSNLKKIPALCQGVPSHLNKCEEKLSCEVCAIANMKRNPFNSKRQQATRPLQIIHTDLCGKISPPTFDGKNYFMTCIDDYTHHVTVYLLEHKNEAESFLKEYILESENHHNQKVSKL